MEDKRIFITPYREGLVERLGITEEDVLKVFDEKSDKAGFFKRGTGKKLRKRCTPIEKFAYPVDQIIAVHDEQHPDEKIDRSPLAAISGWFLVNAGGAYGVLLIYEHEAFILHQRFGANFGFAGLAASAKDLTAKMPIDLRKLTKGNELKKTSVFNYLHYGRFAFYVCSPLEVLHGMIMAKRICDGDPAEVTGNEVLDAAREMAL